MRRFAAQTIVKGEPEQSEDFSLVLGGPLNQLLLRSRLIRPLFGNLSGRIGFITAIAWLPLVAFTIFGGCFTDGVKMPFLCDFEVHARLLFALPLLILAEVIVNIRMRAIAAQFVERQIITGTVLPAFNAVISSAMRIRNSIGMEIGMLLFVVLAGPLVSRETPAIRSDTWYATLSSSTRTR